MLNTAYEIWGIVVPSPPGYKTPLGQKDEDRDRARFIFDWQPELMRKRGFNSSEELLQKYWNDPHGQLPRDPNEVVSRQMER